MANAILFISYLDKFGLKVTVEAGQASAYLYSEARLYKGASLAGPSQSATTRSTGNISVWIKKVGHSRGGLIRRKEAIQGRMDEQPQENVMALVGQWRPTARRPPRWPPPDEDNASRGAMPQPRDMWRPEAWLAAVQRRELCQTSWHW